MEKKAKKVYGEDASLGLNINQYQDREVKLNLEFFLMTLKQKVLTI